jgi:membrane-bound metal-dependent hydrolase YbcI (DUF457 family)
MPSPIGHALAGLVVAWGADLVPGQRRWRLGAPGSAWYRQAGTTLTLTCAALAAAPDLDLLVAGLHRSVTHSLTSVAVVGLIAGLVARRAGLPAIRVAAMCAAAWGSHIPLDWISVDQSAPSGLQILWPFDDRWFISGWDVFPGTERRRLFSEAAMRRNGTALVRELALMTPIVLALWLVRVKALAGFASELARGDHPAE